MELTEANVEIAWAAMEANSGCILRKALRMQIFPCEFGIGNLQGQELEDAWALAVASKERRRNMAGTKIDEVMNMLRMDVPRAETVLSQIKCAEYALHPNTTYLLCFESSLTPTQVQALRLLFEGKDARNVYVICGGEEPKVFELRGDTIKFPEKRMFLQEEVK